MVRNDYRRALILLRAMQSGYSGHVRLERRTMMGSLQFTVTGLGGQPGEAFAVLAARMEGGWKVVRLGGLNRGAGRQAGLHWTFDPRSIEGLPLEEYQFVAVALEDSSGCRLLLFGFLHGTVPLRPEELEEAVCGSSCPYPEPSEGEEDGNSQATAETAQEEALPQITSLSASSVPDPVPEDGVSEGIAPTAEDLLMTAPAQASPSLRDPEDDVLDVPSVAGASVPQTAMALLGLNPERRWPESIEPLRSLFAAGEPFVPFAESGYVFVRADGTGDCPQCAVGVRALDGAPVSVAYAVPAGDEVDPPTGLEGYERRGDWWVIFADADTGSVLV